MHKTQTFRKKDFCSKTKKFISKIYRTIVRPSSVSCLYSFLNRFLFISFALGFFILTKMFSMHFLGFSWVLSYILTAVSVVALHVVVVCKRVSFCLFPMFSFVLPMIRSRELRDHYSSKIGKFVGKIEKKKQNHSKGLNAMAYTYTYQIPAMIILIQCKM